MTKPPTEISNTLYSNFNHELDDDVVEELKLSPDECYAQHAAWDFCGYVWTDGKQWHEEVWVHGSPVETVANDKMLDLIEAVNRKYGGN